MTLTYILLFVHVATAIMWVGGGATMVLLGTRALKAGEDLELVMIMKQTEKLAKMIFMPASVVMLLTGLYASYQISALFSAWVIFAIIGLVASGAIGGMLLSPMIKEYSAIDQSSGATDEAKAIANRMFSVAKFDMVLLFTLVFDMVVQPGWGNWLVLLLMLAVLAAAFFVFMPRDLLPARPGTERTRDFGASDETPDDDET